MTHRQNSYTHTLLFLQLFGDCGAIVRELFIGIRERQNVRKKERKAKTFKQMISLIYSFLKMYTL